MSELFWSPQSSVVLFGSALLIIILVTVRAGLQSRSARTGQALKFIAAVGLFIILLGPMHHRSDHPNEKPSLIVLVDASRSMSLVGEMKSPASANRLSVVRDAWLSTHAQKGFTQATSPSYALVSGGYQPASLAKVMAVAPIAETTPLADSLLETIAQVGADGRILVLTDGVDTASDGTLFDSVAAIAAARSVQIDAVVVGESEPHASLRMRVWAEPEVVYRGEPSTVRIDVVSTGMINPEAKITLYKWKNSDGAALVRRRASLEEERKFSLPVQPQSGRTDEAQAYTVTLETAGAGAGPLSLSRQVFINVIDEPARVALFDSHPYWETTFFVDAMREDPFVELTTIMALTPGDETVRRYSPRRRRGVERLGPVDLEALNQFDVIVLGKGVERWFGAANAGLLRRFVVEDGGALVLLRGDPVSSTDDESDTLRDVVELLSPVSLASTKSLQRSFSPGVDPRGNSTPGDMWKSEAPHLLDVVPELVASPIETGNPGWLFSLRQTYFDTNSGINQPVLAVGSVGRGRTVVSLVNSMWRWVMSPNDLTQSRSLYGRMWSSLVRWAARSGEFVPGRTLNVRFDAGPRQLGDPVEVVVRSRRELAPPGPTASLRGPDGEDRALTLHRSDEAKLKWTGLFTPVRPGVYQLRASASELSEAPATALLAVYENRRELFDTAPRREQMGALAKATGGRVYSIGGVDHYLRDIEQNYKQSLRSSASEPVWNRPWVFLLVFALLGCGWAMMKRQGG